VSPFTNTQALYQRASAWGVRYLEDEQMGASDLPTVLDFVKAFMAGVDHLYLTICLDVLPAFVAPGVSAPSARGVSVEVIEKVLDAACATGKVRVADVAELNPTLDADGRTAAVAARLIGRMVEGCYARSSI
jgi:formiminoglutamase